MLSEPLLLHANVNDFVSISLQTGLPGCFLEIAVIFFVMLANGKHDKALRWRFNDF